MSRKDFKVEPSAIEKREKALEMLATFQPGARSSSGESKWFMLVVGGLFALVLGGGIVGAVLLAVAWFLLA